VLSVALPEIGVDEGGFTPLPPPSAYAITWTKPLVVRSPAARQADGTPVDPQTLARLGFVVTRRTTAGAAEEAWDADASAWAPLSTLLSGGLARENLDLGPFEYSPSGPVPFVGTAMLADEERYVRAPLGAYPRYAVRSYFETARDSVRAAGLSSPTALYSVSDERAFLASMVSERGETPEWIELYLLDPVRVARGKVELRRAGSDAGVHAWTANASAEERARLDLLENGSVQIVTRRADPSRRATVAIDASGDVRVEPAPGRRVYVGGLELEATGAGLRLRNTGAGELVIDGNVRITGAVDLAGPVHVGSHLDVDGIVSARGWVTVP
jgi:hypothetical protein